MLESMSSTVSYTGNYFKLGAVVNVGNVRA